jgi:hypothetical protein
MRPLQYRFGDLLQQRLYIFRLMSVLQPFLDLLLVKWPLFFSAIALSHFLPENTYTEFWIPSATHSLFATSNMTSKGKSKHSASLGSLAPIGSQKTFWPPRRRCHSLHSTYMLNRGYAYTTIISSKYHGQTLLIADIHDRSRSRGRSLGLFWRRRCPCNCSRRSRPS